MKYWIHFSTNVLILKFSISESQALTLLSDVPFLFGLTTGVGPTNSVQVTTRQHKLEKIGKPGSRINWRLSMCILQSRFTLKQASLGSGQALKQLINENFHTLRVRGCLSYQEWNMLLLEDLPPLTTTQPPLPSSSWSPCKGCDGASTAAIRADQKAASHRDAVNGQVDVGG